jgi:hypothetical protein
MLRTYDGHSLLRRRIAVGVLAVAILAAALGAWLAFARPRPDAPDTPPPSQAPALRTETSVGNVEAPATQLKQLAATNDPRTFAEGVARALFTWDTTVPIPLSDYTGRLLAVADPSGQESPGLVADIAAYLPTADAWAFLKPYCTRQWIEISTVTVPDLWSRALAEAGPHGLAPGTTAYTIRGIRHRAGVWEREPVASAHTVSFTVFVVCAPSYPSCHLLRLSRLDEPLG